MSPELQLIIIGIVASLLAAGLRFLAARFTGVVLEKGWMTIVAGAASLILAVIFQPPQLPIYVDPLQYIGEWLVLLSAYVGAATAIYNILLAKLLEKLNLTAERFLVGRHA